MSNLIVIVSCCVISILSFLLLWAILYVNNDENELDQPQE